MSVNGGNSSIKEVDLTSKVLYKPYSSVRDSCDGYYIASPSAQSSTFIWGVDVHDSYGLAYSQAYTRSTTISTGKALRPVICLPPTVKLVLNSETGKYDIVKK